MIAAREGVSVSVGMAEEDVSKAPGKDVYSRASFWPEVTREAIKRGIDEIVGGPAAEGIDFIYRKADEFGKAGNESDEAPRDVDYNIPDVYHPEWEEEKKDRNKLYDGYGI